MPTGGRNTNSATAPMLYVSGNTKTERMKILAISLIFLFFFSCKQIDYKANFTNSSALSFSLLKSSVQATVNIHSSINTTNYVVDLSKGFNLEPLGRDSFIAFKEKSLPVTHEDSVVYYDSNGKARVSKSMIISFDTIKQEDQKSVRVVARKIKSTDTIITVALILKRDENGYVCVKCDESNL